MFYKIGGRNLLYLLLDSIAISGSYGIAYILGENPSFLSIRHFLILTVSFLIPLYFFQVYRIIWEYANIKNMYRLFGAAVSGSLLFLFALFLTDLSVTRVHFTLSFFLIIIILVSYRVLLRDYAAGKTLLPGAKPDRDAVRNILIAGAGEAGRMILSDFTRQGLGKAVTGFVDDDTYKIGKVFNGKQVLGAIDSIQELVDQYDITEIILAMPSVETSRINAVLSGIRRKNREVTIRFLPPITRIFDNIPLISDLEDIRISDLLGREEFDIDASLIENSLSGKTILVTGAGGSIGSEICRQILKFNIKTLIAVGRGENSIYNLVKSLNEYIDLLENRPEVVYKIADIKDSALLGSIFEEYKPGVVFHAAAHKHVPLMEYNEIEALQNNVMGTKNILEQSVLNGVKEFVLISTDKAVNPVNIMGASKRIAELVTLYYHKEHGLKTSIVRFGNVIGSRGSVIPLFREQIKKGGPITVTHPEITRYFMSIPEASLLVINAASFSGGGEIFVLDMEKQFKIREIAENLIRLYGVEPHKDIKITYTGLRPGEKLYEELFYEKEDLAKTPNDKIFIFGTGSSLNKETIDKLESFFNLLRGRRPSDRQTATIFQYDTEKIREAIQSLVPEYDYSSYNKESRLFHKMVN
ncbi:MAG: polysaccharide biosynthesis protein [bacterium]|nr:polysaccharide biosynthesis protein [bacterium]